MAEMAEEAQMAKVRKYMDVHGGSTLDLLVHSPHELLWTTDH